MWGAARAGLEAEGWGVMEKAGVGRAEVGRAGVGWMTAAARRGVASMDVMPVGEAAFWALAAAAAAVLVEAATFAPGSTAPQGCQAVHWLQPCWVFRLRCGCCQQR